MLWFHCDTVTGSVNTAGIAVDEAAALRNTAPQGQTLVLAPDGSVGSPFTAEPDFSVLKDMLCARIDDEAGATRSNFITTVPGQAQTYERKEREARTWTVEADPADFPFMVAEATLRNVSVSVVQAEIMAQVNLLTPLAARIEAYRITTKTLINAASNLPAIINSATVDWNAVVSG